MKLSVPIIATIMAAFANTMANADSSAASVSASGKSGKSADGYSDGEGAFCELSRVLVAEKMVVKFCFVMFRLGFWVTTGGEDYDIGTMAFDPELIDKAQALGLFRDTKILWKMSDGVIPGTVPDGLIQGVELVQYFVSELEAYTCSAIYEKAMLLGIYADDAGEMGGVYRL